MASNARRAAAGAQGRPYGGRRIGPTTTTYPVACDGNEDAEADSGGKVTGALASQVRLLSGVVAKLRDRRLSK